MALAVACTSVVVEPGQSSGTTSGSGGATSSTTTTTTTITGDVGGGFISSSSSGGPLCADANLFIDITGDVPFQHVDASCEPSGFLIFGSAGPKPPPPPGPPQPLPSGAGIFACGGSQAFVINVSASGSVWPGTSTMGSIHYAIDGVEWANGPADDVLLEIDVVDPIGGVMEGSFSGVLAPPPGTTAMPKKVTGKFRVCHAWDEHLA